MEPGVDLDALTLRGGRVLRARSAIPAFEGHDIPHPIGDPEEDEGLPSEDDDDEDDGKIDDDDDDDD